MADLPISTATQSALDLKANNNEVVKLTWNQTIAWTKTFTSSPIVPTPTTDMEVATKKYVDDNTWWWATLKSVVFTTRDFSQAWWLAHKFQKQSTMQLVTLRTIKLVDWCNTDSLTDCPLKRLQSVKELKSIAQPFV